MVTLGFIAKIYLIASLVCFCRLMFKVGKKDVQRIAIEVKKDKKPSLILVVVVIFIVSFLYSLVIPYAYIKEKLKRGFTYVKEYRS